MCGPGPQGPRGGQSRGLGAGGAHPAPWTRLGSGWGTPHCLHWRRLLSLSPWTSCEHLLKADGGVYVHQGDPGFEGMGRMFTRERGAPALPSTLAHSHVFTCTHSPAAARTCSGGQLVVSVGAGSRDHTRGRPASTLGGTLWWRPSFKDLDSPSLLREQLRSPEVTSQLTATQGEGPVRHIPRHLHTGDLPGLRPQTCRSVHPQPRGPWCEEPESLRSLRGRGDDEGVASGYQPVLPCPPPPCPHFPESHESWACRDLQTGGGPYTFLAPRGNLPSPHQHPRAHPQNLGSGSPTGMVGSILSWWN